MNRRRFLILAGSAATPVAAAGIGLKLLPGDSARADVPSVHWDEDACAHCRMVISDRRFAAGWIEEDGQQSLFDDAGCMVAMYREHAPGTTTRVFARDYINDRWLDAATAVYFQAESIRSPMAYGVAAFASRADGIGELGHTAVPQDWDDLVQNLERQV